MKHRLPGALVAAASLICTSTGFAAPADEAAPPIVLSPLPETAATGNAALGPTPAPTPGVPLIAFEKLIPFLPAPPTGWAAESPQGSTTDTEERKLSTAPRSYHLGDADEPPTASITIIDFARNRRYLDGITSAWKLKDETPEGYDKPVDLNGIRGFEHYARVLQGSSLSAVVADRFYIQIELTKSDPKQLREWIGRIDLKKLAELK